jgi:hypothetical protein
MHVNNKSKSAISFKEFEQKMNEHHYFENEWGFYVDIENNKLILIQNNKQNNNKNEQTIYSRLFNKYFVVICIGVSIFVLMLI